MTDKDTVLKAVRAQVRNLVYYDRLSCQDIPLGAIEDLIQSGDLKVEDMVRAFRQELMLQVRFKHPEDEPLEVLSEKP